ncbi:hypothetical protein Lfu02_71400 [Longispora fulva]|uniref:Uma2 family endonuclease n=1 Tax=Longispora fulva TaxID=619741 RepID=A0A8J7GMT0_9ACTN|nr:Uma2 family endonuclease [Longispora fulva]MBG6141236.1 Uma2 family endonuclease [Longispora fulva]GIG62768.1 hypothetical protein Lfu02_71400 [Longispora fulva]
MTQPGYDWKMPDAWTEETIAALPDDGHRYEIFDGSLVISAPGDESHPGIQGNLYARLWNAAPEGWRIRTDLGLRLPSANLTPDIVVLKPDAVRGEEWTPVAGAALVVEIASRSTQMNDRTSKPAFYAEAGIPAYWRIDREGNLHVYELINEGRYTITATVPPGERWSTRYPFPFALDPAELSDRPDPADLHAPGQFGLPGRMKITLATPCRGPALAGAGPLVTVKRS